MKKLLAACLLVSGCASVSPAPAEHPQVTAIRAELHAEAVRRGEDPSAYVVKDTGEVMDLGAGEGPVVEMYRKDLPQSCLMAVHPTELLWATLMCGERTPTQDM